MPRRLASPVFPRSLQVAPSSQLKIPEAIPSAGLVRDPPATPVRQIPCRIAVAAPTHGAPRSSTTVQKNPGEARLRPHPKVPQWRPCQSDRAAHHLRPRAWIRGANCKDPRSAPNRPPATKSSHRSRDPAGRSRNQDDPGAVATARPPHATPATRPSRSWRPVTPAPNAAHRRTDRPLERGLPLRASNPEGPGRQER